MTHSDEYVLEEVEEVDVVTQIKTLATQMQENAKKIKLLEDETVMFVKRILL